MTMTGGTDDRGTCSPSGGRYRGRGYYMAGDIAIIRGSEPTDQEIAMLAGFRRPRGILWIDSIGEVTRTPHTRLVWGECGEVRHREDGLTYIFDPSRVMFAMGNRSEKTRIARMVQETGRAERIADMFAGIGYFTIPLAAAGGRIHAMEINPAAYDYLVRSVRANALESRVTPALGDCRHLLTGIYDRIVMGHFDALQLLGRALEHAASGTVIHVHSIGTAEDRIRNIAEGAGFSVTIQVHKVKKYRPHTWHMVQDVHLA